MLGRIRKKEGLLGLLGLLVCWFHWGYWLGSRKGDFCAERALGFIYIFDTDFTDYTDFFCFLTRISRIARMFFYAAGFGHPDSKGNQFFRKGSKGCKS